MRIIHVDTPPGVGAVFTGREFDLAPGRGSDAIGRLAGAVGLAPDRIVANQQVHGNVVLRVSKAQQSEGCADGLVTDAAGLALVARGADCLPVLMWRTDGSAVAAAHAGWRGIVGGIIGATVASLGDPGGLAVAIGPGIGPCCYPVSDDVRDTFADQFGAETVVGSAVDLGRATRIALERAGVSPAAIADRLACTACDPLGRFYSYRREGAAAGRHAGLIWRRGEEILNA